VKGFLIVLGVILLAPVLCFLILERTTGIGVFRKGKKP
jgi:hypothetical protein